jgi:hypothetical protein
MPVPMMPRLNSTKVNSPASGRSASAACAEVWMSVTPTACSVAAVLRMMKKAIRFENVIPTIVSTLMRRRWRRRSLGECGGLSLVSSISCAACQKKR